jgi:hypothetical protein
MTHIKKFEVIVKGTYISRVVVANDIKDARNQAKDIFSNIPDAKFQIKALAGFFLNNEY